MKCISIILFAISLFACAESLGTTSKAASGSRCYSDVNCHSSYCVFNDQSAPGYCSEHTH